MRQTPVGPTLAAHKIANDQIMIRSRQSSAAVFGQPMINKPDNRIKPVNGLALLPANGLHQLVNAFDIFGTSGQRPRRR